MQSKLETTDDITQTLLSLPFDHYQRYALTRQIASLFWGGQDGEGLQVLDVGGHMSSLKLFLPRANVTVTDPMVPPSATHRGLPFLCDSYVRAQGEQLPFADSSFGLVAAHDTLEHVAPDQREAFLRELFRVARDLVVVNGPVYRPEAREAEERLNSFIGQLFNTPQPSLVEHLELGLPEPELIERVAREASLPFVVIPNGNLASWLVMMAMKHYLAALPEGEAVHEALDRAYNAIFSPRDFQEACYRSAYVISLRQDGAPALERIAAAFPVRPEERYTPPSLPELASFIQEMETHGRSVNETVREMAASQRQLEALLGQKDAVLAKKNAVLAEKERRIASAEATLAETEQQLREVQQQFQAATSALGYRLLERTRAVINRLAPPGTLRRGVLKLFRKGLRISLAEGWVTFLRRGVQVWRWAPRLIRRAGLAASVGSLDEQYQLWLRAHALTPARVRRIRKEAARLSCRPKVSIVMPVYNSDAAWLREAIESVRGQLYDDWELCIADDASSEPAVRELLQEYEGDERIKVTYLEENQGISAASNAALALATGEYVGFLDHDDELKPDALYEVVKLLNEQPDLDFIYSDEDKRSPDGRLVQPFFKPDWSPDLLLSINYVPHFAVYRKRTVDEVGGLRSECDFSQDYDLALRVTERTNRIGHVALPLYTWRMIPGSAASEVEAKPRSTEAAKRALADAMRRRGIGAEILEGPFKTAYRVRYRIRGEPLVSIIIPTRDRVELLSRCIASIKKKTSYRNYEIIVVDNDSRDEKTLDYLKKSPHRCITYPGAFHYAGMMNFAVRETAGEHVIMLNNDTEVISPEWVEAMLEHSQRPEVAAVGARLFYPDGRRVQHEGIIIGLGGGSAGNVDHGGYFGLGKMVRNLSAVTGACMMVRRDVFEGLGGFDESLGIAFNDVDYCLRAREQGYLIVYTPYSVLYHHEGGTRGRLHPMEDERFFRSRWGEPGQYRDPYYNPNLSLRLPFTVIFSRE